MESEKNEKIFNELLGGEIMSSKLTKYLKTQIIEKKSHEDKLKGSQHNI